jgi:lipid-A-disaccharide synthase
MGIFVQPTGRLRRETPLALTSDDRETEGRPLIFISAAEPSADLHGAALIRATLAKCPTARFAGVAGPKMIAEGCQPIFDMTRHSAMLLGALQAVGRAIAMLTTAEQHLRRYPFDAAVVIDSPTLHLPLARRAQAAAIPVMYYIAPQMWAWGAYRIHRLRNRTDRVAVILPFEEKYFRDQGVNATYVGHPLAESLASALIDENVVNQIRSRGSPVIALLPGSRRHVVKEVLHGQLEVAERITLAVPGAAFEVSVANAQLAPVIESLLSKCRVPVQPHPGSCGELIHAADLVLVASGTAALEVAFHEKPMIVMYNTSRVFYHLIGRWLIHTPYLCLPNILAGRKIVPEFMPYYTSTEPIAEQAIELLRSEDKRRAMEQELAALVEPLRTRRASERAADMLLDMVRRAGQYN